LSGSRRARHERFNVKSSGSNGALRRFRVEVRRHVLDCQANLLRDLNTRFVVPLLPLQDAPRQAQQLNPLFEIDGQPYVMITQFCAAIAVTELGPKVASLHHEAMRVINALDMLISGC
jgi:toxin CcdB